MPAGADGGGSWTGGWSTTADADAVPTVGGRIRPGRPAADGRPGPATAAMAARGPRPGRRGAPVSTAAGRRRSRGIAGGGAGDDLAEPGRGAPRCVAGRLGRPGDGDVVVVTSKVVSKAEGRVVAPPTARRDRRGDRAGRRTKRTPRGRRGSWRPGTGWCWRRRGSTPATPRPGRWSCCPRTRTPRARGCAGRWPDGSASDVGRRGDRHPRPALARGPDRRGGRGGRPGRVLDDHRGRVDGFGTPWR